MVDIASSKDRCVAAVISHNERGKMVDKMIEIATDPDAFNKIWYKHELVVGKK